MKGLDTNILVRFFTKDDQEQFEQVFQLFSQQDLTFFISYPVLVELVWVLERGYNFNKQQIIFVLDELLDTKHFHFENANNLKEAITLFKNNSADFSDCLIGVLGTSNKCDSTYTFDKKATQLGSFSLLQ